MAFFEKAFFWMNVLTSCVFMWNSYGQQFLFIGLIDCFFAGREVVGTIY